MSAQHITIAGGGLAGLCAALECLRHGARVTLFDPGVGPVEAGVARYAGGMLAPWCERESAEEEVITLGATAADWWAEVTEVTRAGTLVVAPPRDRGELARFARRTRGYRVIASEEVTSLEPALEGRFREALYFEAEAHLDPRRALADLAARIAALGGELRYGEVAPERVDLDCRGLAAPVPGLRPVRGEMAILECNDIDIARTIRMLHPRIPLYLVPRGGGMYMIGATMIESSSIRAPTVRSLSDMLSAAFALHPGFAEASVIETGAGLRPAFADNLPRLVRERGVLHLNGLFRHGFLLAPALAVEAARLLIGQEGRDENHRECETA